jgi:hypothetical protein
MGARTIGGFRVAREIAVISSGSLNLPEVLD